MRRIISLLTACAILLMSSLTVLTVYAEEKNSKVVRVGWYESTYCYFDQFGRRCGLVYEYQQKIAAHTGWTYEYVEDSWINLLEMLKEGKIDLMSDVSYTEERAKDMLYSNLEMGTESYYIYIDADNHTIDSENITTFNGKKIGVNKATFQEGLLKEWMQKNEISAEIIELTGIQPDSLEKVTSGEIDAFVTQDSLQANEKMVPVCKIGSSDYYFAVNKDRPDLHTELNRAMSKIQDEDPYFNEKIMDEWIHLTKTNAFLDHSLEKWLSEHGSIRIGYLDNYLPFCTQNKETGEVDGALKDYIAHASTCMKNADIHFETKPYQSNDDALRAMKNGEIDCVFPINISSYEGETNGLLKTSPVMQTEMSFMQRKESTPDKIVVAIDKENVNYSNFIMDNLPDWEIKEFPDIEACYSAVANRKADAVLVGNYRTGFMEPMEIKYNLTVVPTGKYMSFSFAVKRNDHELFYLMDKISNLSLMDDMDYVLASYMYTPHKVTLMQFLKDNWIIVILVISAFFAVILILLARQLKAEKKIIAQQKQMEDALRRELQQQKELQLVTRKAYTDPLTGVKSKHSFLEAEEKMDQRIAEKSVTEFAVVVFDLNDLKIINDTKGHSAGDQYIKDACRIICTSFKHSPVYRIGGDEFVAIVQGEDYANRNDIIKKFEDTMDSNIKQGLLTIASGYSCFDPEKDDRIEVVMKRADNNMYQRKKKMKEA